MPIVLNTSRGRYALAQAAPPEDVGDATVLTFALERADGIERVALRCRIAKALVAGLDDSATMTLLARWIERDFETIRENALKSIRSEHKLIEVVFDQTNRGPF